MSPPHERLDVPTFGSLGLWTFRSSLSGRLDHHWFIIDFIVGLWALWTIRSIINNSLFNVLWACGLFGRLDHDFLCGSSPIIG